MSKRVAVLDLIPGMVCSRIRQESLVMLTEEDTKKMM